MQCNRLDQLLNKAANEHPQRPAIESDGEVLTYLELDREVSVLSQRLAAHGLSPGHRVGIYMPKSFEAVQSIYASLRLGAVVTPLDVKDPVQRSSRMLANAGLDFLLTIKSIQSGAEQVAREFCGDVITVVALEFLNIQLISLYRDAARHIGDSGGYVLFTSGSTGWPKGVRLSHENVLHFARWAMDAVGLTSDDRVGSQASLTFDLTTFDLFASALAGACVCLLPDYMRAFPRDVTHWLNKQRVSVFYAVPTLYQSMLLQGGIEECRPATLRVLMYAGEPFPPQLLRRYLTSFPDLPIYNLYGPTETNVCTFERVESTDIGRTLPSIGYAIEGVEVGIIGEDGCAADVGEIFVSGPTVFEGYLLSGICHDARKSVRFRDGVERLAYGTGDIGFQEDDGRFYLQGRRDSQVKRRGHRIDLLDIEGIVLAMPGVETAAVVAKHGEDNECEIWVYVVAPGLSNDVINRALRDVLPMRMLPDVMMMVPNLPLTPNGKIDRCF